MKTARIVLTIGFTIAAGNVGILGQQEGRGGRAGAPPIQSVASPFNGDWLLQDPGSGSFTEWFDNVSPAKVTPEATKYNEWYKTNAAAGNVTNTMERRPDCPPPGGQPLPGSMAGSNSKNIVIGRTEARVAARTVHLDGRSLPDTKSPQFIASTMGYSFGRFEGPNTLVVETVGFPGWGKVCESNSPTIRVPGGGVAVDTTRLVERYQMTGPDTLTITFTWTDPTVYLAPHTYTYNLKRITLPTPDPAKAPTKREFLTDKYWPRSEN